MPSVSATRMYHDAVELVNERSLLEVFAPQLSSFVEYLLFDLSLRKFRFLRRRWLRLSLALVSFITSCFRSSCFVIQSSQRLLDGFLNLSILEVLLRGLLRIVVICEFHCVLFVF